MSSKARPFIIQGLIAIAVVIVGIIVARAYLMDRVKPKKMPMRDVGVLVEVIPVTKEPHVVKLSGTGQVEMSHSQQIKSEANGRITWINPGFYPGARIKKGEVIAKINTDDYATKLSNAKIQLRQKEVSLMQEEAKGRAASAELDALKKSMADTDLTEEEADLVRRKPQLQNAIADVELAKNNVAQAQRDYNRSIVKAPYDAVVKEANVSMGDYITGGSLGTLVSTDEYWVYLSLNPSNVGWLKVGESLSSLKAEVEYDIGGKHVTRAAKVKSVQPAVESLGRMVQILLAIENPLGEPVNEPLLVGTFVTASIYAEAPLDSIELSRAFVRERNQAYICTKDNKLSIRTLTTPYKTNDNVYVTEGIEEGERVVTTMLTSPVEGRRLRVKGETKEMGDVPDDGGRGFGPPGMGGPPR